MCRLGSDTGLLRADAARMGVVRCAPSRSIGKDSMPGIEKLEVIAFVDRYAIDLSLDPCSPITVTVASIRAEPGVPSS